MMAEQLTAEQQARKQEAFRRAAPLLAVLVRRVEERDRAEAEPQDGEEVPHVEARTEVPLVKSFQFSDGDLDRFVTIAEAAARLRIGRSTAYRLIDAGTFPAPIQVIAGKQVVSLRRLAEFIHAIP